MNISITPKHTILAGAVVAVSMLLAQSAFAKEGDVQIGKLECDVKGGIGLILGSKKKMTCTFTKSDGSVENYTGRVTKVGVDIGFTKKSKIIWAVLAPSKTADKGALAGNYNGVAVEATVAAGIGGNILVSAGNAFTLQPFSIQGKTGLNVAGGLEQIKLEYAK